MGSPSRQPLCFALSGAPQVSGPGSKSANPTVARIGSQRDFRRSTPNSSNGTTTFTNVVFNLHVGRLHKLAHEEVRVVQL